MGITPPPLFYLITENRISLLVPVDFLYFLPFELTHIQVVEKALLI